MNNRQKIYDAAHQAAVAQTETDAADAKKEAKDRARPEDAHANAAAAFKAAGFSNRQDLDVFLTYFQDERLKLRSLGTLKLPSELAAETV